MRQSRTAEPAGSLDMVPSGETTEVLIRLWDEAERALVVHPPMAPAQANPAELRPVRVRFAFD